MFEKLSEFVKNERSFFLEYNKNVYDEDTPDIIYDNPISFARYKIIVKEFLKELKHYETAARFIIEKMSYEEWTKLPHEEQTAIIEASNAKEEPLPAAPSSTSQSDPLGPGGASSAATTNEIPANGTEAEGSHSTSSSAPSSTSESVESRVLTEVFL